MAVLPHMGRRGFRVPSLAATGYGRGYFREVGLNVTIQPVRNRTTPCRCLRKERSTWHSCSTSPALCNRATHRTRMRIAATREFMTNCIDIGVLYERKKAFPCGDREARTWRGNRVALQSCGAISEFAFDTVRKVFGVRANANHPMYRDRATGLAALLSGGVHAKVNGFAFPLDTGQRRDEFIRHDTAPSVLDGMQYSYIVFSAMGPR
jgi:hypothetical protein